MLLLIVLCVVVAVAVGLYLEAKHEHTSVADQIQEDAAKVGVKVPDDVAKKVGEAVKAAGDAVEKVVK